MNQENERLYTPKEIETTGYKGFKMCQATQVEKRKNGLSYYKIGNKVYYGQAHLDNYLAGCEVNASSGQS